MKYKGRFGDLLMASPHRVLRERSHCRLCCLKARAGLPVYLPGCIGRFKVLTAAWDGHSSCGQGHLSSNCGCVLTCCAILGFSGDFVP